MHVVIFYIDRSISIANSTISISINKFVRWSDFNLTWDKSILSKKKKNVGRIFKVELKHRETEFSLPVTKSDI